MILHPALSCSTRLLLLSYLRVISLARARPVATYKYTLPHHFILLYCKQVFVVMFDKTGHLASAHREEKHYGCNEDSIRARILWDKSSVRLAKGERRTTANGQESWSLLHTVDLALLAKMRILGHPAPSGSPQPDFPTLLQSAERLGLTHIQLRAYRIAHAAIFFKPVRFVPS